MRIVVVVEYARSLAWSPSQWAGSIVRGLLERGHEVVLLADGADDPAEFRSAGREAEVRLRRPLRTVRGRKPLAFGRWVDECLAGTTHDMSLSLARTAGADLWAPVGPAASADFAALVRARSPATLAIEALHEPWLPAALLAERRASKRVGRRVNIGQFSAGPGEGAADDVGLGFASAYEPFTEDARAMLRRRARLALGISESRPIILASGVHLSRPGTRTCLRGLARAAARGGPITLLLTREPVAAHRLMSDIGEGVRAIGCPQRIDLLAAACDAAATGGRGEGTGRFVADALRLGLPVLCGVGAPGAALVDPKAFGAGPVGMLVRDDEADWQVAAEQVMERAWREDAAGAARCIAPVLSMGSFVQRVERALGGSRAGAGGEAARGAD
ncbi:MAG: hypothetical protein IT439_12875 [Phycisphaerales bacterium]|nr:hypothetical protein [Phycisphaerales bacterium]